MKPVICIDIETPMRDPIASPWLDGIYMCGIWDGKSYTCARNAAAFQEALRYQYPGYDLVGHNTNFDTKFLKVQGWMQDTDFEGRNIHDTRMIGSLVKARVPKAFLDQYEVMRKEINKTLPTGVSHRKGSFLSLKVMAPWYLKVPPFWETPGDHDNEEYNQFDCMYTYRLFKLLGERLQAEGSWEFYKRHMLEWSKMIRDMEIKGITASNEEIDKVEREYVKKRYDLHVKLDEVWDSAHKRYRESQQEQLRLKYDEMAAARMAKGKDPLKVRLRYDTMYDKALSKLDVRINYASPPQMSWLLKEHLGLDIKNFEGEESTGKAVLNKLAQDREDIRTYLAWREADKVLTMYIPTYKELQYESVIHPSFNLTGTRTGRTSSSGPNLQQVPPKLYCLFKPRDGMKFIQYDLSGIEAALIALYSGDTRLYTILEQGESIHDHNAKAMFDLNCTIAEVSRLYPRQRKVVKNIGFACFYGAGWRRISQVFAAGGFPISDAEAKNKLKLLKSYYPGVFEFHKEITEVFEAGHTVMNYIGRPVTIQAHENPYMQGFNSLIQSSASDLNLEGCKRWWKAGYSPLIVIHDCVIGEVKAEIAEFAAGQLVKCMTDFKLNSVNGPIQLRVEGGVSDIWEK